MPLITTHNYFANEVLEASNIKSKQLIKEKHTIYELFAQGFDPLFFYEFLPFRQKIGNYCHQNHTDEFFTNFIKLIKKNNAKNNPSILASLFGHLTHYCLDSTAHPYIIYKTGEYNKTKPKTIKYNGKHTKMEWQIDAFLYNQKTKKEFAKFKIHKHLITKEKLDKLLLQILNQNYKEILNIKKGGTKYQQGCRLMYYTYKFLIVDTTGLKAKIYKLIDKLTPKKYGVYENYSSHITYIDTSIFNEEHKLWLNPWNNKVSSTESFFDLYEKAKKTCLELFSATELFLDDNIGEEEYKKILKDKAYNTGLSWKIKKEIKYLEF